MMSSVQFVKLIKWIFKFLGIVNNLLPDWIIGLIFLTRYYSVYDVDRRRIGLALAM